MKKLVLSLAILFGMAAQAAFGAATILPPESTCFQGTSGLTGFVGALGTIVPGTGGTSGVYGGVALTGGTGAGATANVTVSGGGVTAVAILNPGVGYAVSDTLSAASGNIGNVTGFSVPVNSVSINSSLAGGSVTFYQPNTQTFKQTWFNADQASSHVNTDPVTLDQNGCAVVYGSGSYTEVVKDSLGNTVYSGLTTDTSANNNTFWAGNAGGTPNVISVTDAGWNATDGSVLQFTAIATNTGSVTISPSGAGPYPVLKSTTSGPVVLTGGEIIQNNPVSVIYSASATSFILLNPPIQSAAASSAPLCGATGFLMVNDSTAPNSLLDITATSAVTVSASGLAFNRSNVSVKINFLINGAGGLDTGNLAANSVYSIFLIDNGATIAGLASAAVNFPQLPAGFSFVCRVGAVPTNNSSQLLPIYQAGNETAITSGASFFTFGSGGGICGSSFIAVTFGFPSTAQYAVGRLVGTGTSAIGVGLSTTGPEISGYSAVSPGGPGLSMLYYFRVPLPVPQTIYYCSNSSSDSLSITGWVDSVNVH